MQGVTWTSWATPPVLGQPASRLASDGCVLYKDLHCIVTRPACKQLLYTLLCSLAEMICESISATRQDALSVD